MNISRLYVMINPTKIKREYAEYIIYNITAMIDLVPAIWYANCSDGRYRLVMCTCTCTCISYIYICGISMSFN